jgi:hypothetical protein
LELNASNASNASDASNGEDNVRAELRELKEAVVVSNASNVELRAELREWELKESAFISSASMASDASNGEDNVKGVVNTPIKEDNIDVDVNATSSEAKSAKLAKSA